MFEDSKGRFWVGTISGLNQFDRSDGACTVYYEKHGLQSAQIYGILEDRRGFLWISTAKNLACMDPEKKTFRIYDVGDGLQSSEFNANALARGSDGAMYFGGINGFNKFYPDGIQDNPIRAVVAITDFRKWGNSVTLEKDFPYLTGITLPYSDNFIGFEFAALHFTAPEKNRYAYTLEGLDEGWIYNGTSRTATFTNLDPGSYVFRVKAANSDGVWNEEATSIRVTITPPLWKTWWFRIGAGIALIALTVTGHRQRVRKLARENMKLELKVAERTKQLEQTIKIVKSINSETELSDLLNSILHEIKPLTHVRTASILLRDTLSGTFKFKACYGCDFKVLAPIELTAEEAQRRYVEQGEVISEDIYVVRNLEQRPIQEKFGGLPSLGSLLTVCIRGTDQAEGYLLFDEVGSEDLARDAILLLKGLREHLRSAVIKARILGELKMLNEKKNEYLGIVAHDLRSPLSTILGYADLLIADLKADTMVKDEAILDLEKISGVTRHMSRFISELLDISAIESGKVRMQLRSLHLLDLVEDCAGIHRRAAERKNIQLIIEPKKDLPLVTADAAKISSVVDNLLSNAVKYTHPGGRVRVYFEVDDRSVRTHVEDTGLGLDAEDLRVIFSSFKKLSARPTGGESSTGLGLAIVKKIVELHRGEVGVRSQKGKGSTFSFSIPIV